ncbi:MAG: diguanylate cyclase [Oscillospiraceae bacterium]|nr:diguanylate cyclase [Oscillospiraceae bacterium]
MALNRRQKEKLQKVLDCGVFDIYDADVAVVSPRDCETVWLNAHAKARLASARLPEDDCGAGCSHLFPALCEYCGLYSREEKGASAPVDIVDNKQRVFSLKTGVTDIVEGGPYRVFILRDVDEERNAGKMLRKLIYTDQLTNMPNRRKFTEDFRAVADGAAKGNICGLAAFFDIDNFKNINDTYGHDTGDVMLAKLTERLEKNLAYNGRLYRLGGDEFFLFCVDKADRFASQDDRRKYYEEMLSGALISYSLPDIEVSCTLSIGAAFFPEQGADSSELLRKADIALHRAKATGRNRLVFFEDRYDTAKNFRDIYVTLQPVLTSYGKTFGYELVDRGNDRAVETGAVNLTGSDRPARALGLEDPAGSALCFVSYSPRFFDETVLNALSKDKFIIQFSAEECKSEREIKKLRELHEHGYYIALTNLKGSVTNEFLSLADFCKFASVGAPSDSMKAWLIANNSDKKFIATNINSHAEYEEAKRRGFKLFQGFWFNELSPGRATEADPLTEDFRRLLRMACAKDYFTIRDIGSLISSDPALSDSFLRLLNSEVVGLQNISSFSTAVAYLGEENLKKWTALLAVRGLGFNKPPELVRLSLIRAQFGSLLAPYFTGKRNPNTAFFAGMFSLLHVILDKTPEETFEEIRVSEELRESLVLKTGTYSDLAPFFRSYEFADWDSVGRFAEKHGLDSKLINDSYTAAVRWFGNLETV